MQRKRYGAPWEHSGLFHIMVIMFDAGKSLSAKQIDNKLMEYEHHVFSESYAGVADFRRRSK